MSSPDPNAHQIASHHRPSRRTASALTATFAALSTLAAAPDAAAHAVHARGRLVYAQGSALKPLEHVRVRLLDADVDFDDLLDSGYTDAHGRFDLSGDADDWGGLCGKACKPDPYVVFALDDGKLDVRTLLGVTYTSRTRMVRNTSGKIDLGTVKFGDTTAARLFTRGREQYEEFSEQTGEDVPRNGGLVEIAVPALTAGVPYATVDTIHWPGGYTGWSAIYHEFGHRLRHAADGGMAHFLFDVARFAYMKHHTPDMKTNLGFAFNEGWAEYHATLLDQTAAQQLAAFADDDLGDDVEGRVAYKLYRLAQSCGGFAPMWQTLKDASIHSFAEFRDAFLARHPGCVEADDPALLAKAVRPGPPPASVSQAEQVQALRRHLDELDSRATEVAPRRRFERAQLARAGVEVAVTVSRLQDRRIAFAESWDSHARAAYRRLLLGVPPLTARSAADGSHEKALLAARDEFVGELVGERLRQVAELRRELDQNRRRAKDKQLIEYLRRLDAKYTRHDASLRRALASRGTGDFSVPLDVLPPSFSTPAVPVAAK